MNICERTNCYVWRHKLLLWARQEDSQTGWKQLLRTSKTQLQISPSHVYKERIIKQYVVQLTPHNFSEAGKFVLWTAQDFTAGTSWKVLGSDLCYACMCMVCFTRLLFGQTCGCWNRRRLMGGRHGTRVNLRCVVAGMWLGTWPRIWDRACLRWWLRICTCAWCSAFAEQFWASTRAHVIKKIHAMANAQILASDVRLCMHTRYCIPNCDGGVDPLCEAGIAVPKSSSSYAVLKKTWGPSPYTKSMQETIGIRLS